MTGSSSSVGFKGVTLVTGGGGVTNWVDLDDTAASITANEFVRGNAGGTALEFAAVSATTLQGAYDASTGGATPEITLDATRGAVTIRDNATPVGNMLEVQDNASENKLAVAPERVDVLGISGRRLFEVSQDAGDTGRGGIEYFPDGATFTTVAANNFALLWSSTVTSNVAGGGGFGNDLSVAMVSALGTCVFADKGNVFSSSLLFNQATKLQLQDNIGPIYTMVNQPQWIADGGSFSSSQHNALRIQPRWGPNINGGSISQTNASFILFTATVDATVGSANVTTMTNLLLLNPVLTAGGTIGTWEGLNIADISGPSLIFGIRSAMNNGSFISHTGSSQSFFSGNIVMANAVSLVLGSLTGGRVGLSRTSASVMRMIGAGGTNNEGLDWDFDTATANNIAVTSSTSAGLNFNTDEIAFGSGLAAAANHPWQVAFAPPARTYTVGATDVARKLTTAGGGLTLNAAVTNCFTDIINEPFIAGGTNIPTNSGNMLLQTNVGIGTNRYGLLITCNPSGGTLNYALRLTLGDARFDGRVDINNGIALGGGAAPTLGTIGGSGPTTAAQAQWLEVDIGGTPHWIAVWT